jgi:hypothetical protein
MITVHHLINSRSQRVLRLLEELGVVTAFLHRIRTRDAYQRALERGGAYSF